MNIFFIGMFITFGGLMSREIEVFVVNSDKQLGTLKEALRNE